MPLFGKPKDAPTQAPRSRKKKEMPEGLWTKCESCGEIIYNKTLEEQLRVCPKCQHHFTLGARERIDTLADPGTFHELNGELMPLDPLKFQGPAAYKDKLLQEQATFQMRDACLTGTATLGGHEVMLAATDSRFMMGSMGSVLGEKVTRAAEHALEKRLPLIIVSGSGGGARMQEGLFSLMQMAKTSAALSHLHQAGGLFISVLTHPTMAGVMASFAALGDVIIAEPRALIGFTGPRVIEQTIRQKLPEGFQRSEFLLEHGLIDCIVARKELKATLIRFVEDFTVPHVPSHTP
ncbi:MAG: acetyl-CoA carboxylase carboxyltransferase subunit beta [Candidatus Omnitrophica bacterium]|nr:acetyl-CoA carboxylase carboxyltransferase subunit beta [Candidatus Omnitrophota bacterium]